jgi:hypothetical protein
MLIRIKNKGHIITSKEIDSLDLIREKDSTTLIMDLFMKYYKLDVSKYRISDVNIDTNKHITLIISDDDLIELRNRKIDELGIN